MPCSGCIQIIQIDKNLRMKRRRRVCNCWCLHPSLHPALVVALFPEFCSSSPLSDPPPLLELGTTFCAVPRVSTLQLRSIASDVYCPLKSIWFCTFHIILSNGNISLEISTFCVNVSTFIIYLKYSYIC